MNGRWKCKCVDVPTCRRVDVECMDRNVKTDVVKIVN